MSVSTIVYVCLIIGWEGVLIIINSVKMLKCSVPYSTCLIKGPVVVALDSNVGTY